MFLIHYALMYEGIYMPVPYFLKIATILNSESVDILYAQ